MIKFQVIYYVICVVFTCIYIYNRYLVHLASGFARVIEDFANQLLFFSTGIVGTYLFLDETRILFLYSISDSFLYH